MRGKNEKSKNLKNEYAKIIGHLPKTLARNKWWKFRTLKYVGSIRRY